MKIIAHRGFSSQAPENTMAAFEWALHFGVDGLEFDVHLTRDGVPVICHDEAVDRTTNGQGLVKDYTYEELTRLDAGSWYGPEFRGERIPALMELLERVRQTDLLINIELKTNIFTYPGIEEQVTGMLRDLAMVDQCLISSFNHYTLVRTLTIMPQLRIGALYETDLYQPWRYAKTFNANALHPGHHSINPAMVAAAHEAGLMVNPWTVDQPEAIRRVSAAGADALITNCPDVAKSVLQQTGVII